MHVSIAQVCRGKGARKTARFCQRFAPYTYETPGQFQVFRSAADSETSSMGYCGRRPRARGKRKRLAEDASRPRTEGRAVLREGVGSYTHRNFVCQPYCKEHNVRDAAAASARTRIHLGAYCIHTHTLRTLETRAGGADRGRAGPTVLNLTVCGWLGRPEYHIKQAICIYTCTRGAARTFGKRENGDVVVHVDEWE